MRKRGVKWLGPLGARPDSVWTARGFETGCLSDRLGELCYVVGGADQRPLCLHGPQGRAAGIVEIPVLA